MVGIPLERHSCTCFNYGVRRNAEGAEVADLIGRFLENRLAYPHQWNDFLEFHQKGSGRRSLPEEG